MCAVANFGVAVLNSVLGVATFGSTVIIVGAVVAIATPIVASFPKTVAFNGKAVSI